MNFKKIAVLLFLFLLLLHPPLCAEPKDDDLVFTVFGDSRVAFQGAPIPVAYKRILTEINLINPDLIVHTGDLVFGYGDSEQQLKIEYSNVGKLVSTVVPKIYFVPGNHDFQTPLTTKHFMELTGQKRDYFSFDRKGVTFIILNTDLPRQVGEITGEQRKWLENELEKKKSSRAIFVFMHRPLFSFLKPNADDKGDLPEAMYNFVSEQARWDLIDLLVKYQVTAVMAGHEHLYYRTDYKGVPFITLGGGGATFSAPPDKGGFFSYMIVSVKGEEVKFDLMEPYHFSVETKTYQKNGKTYGEALIHSIHAEALKGVIPLRGIKLTLPQGEYTVKGESLVSAHQMVKIGEALGAMTKGSPEVEKATEKEIQGLIKEYLKPYIHKIEPNKEKRNMVDVWISLDTPFSVLLTVSPES